MKSSKYVYSMFLYLSKKNSLLDKAIKVLVLMNFYYFPIKRETKRVSIGGYFSFYSPIL